MQRIKTDTCRSQVSDNLQHYIKLKGMKKLFLNLFFKYDVFKLCTYLNVVFMIWYRGSTNKIFYQQLYFDI